MRDKGLIPGLVRSPWEGNSKPLQYSCLGNPMDRGAWWATVHGVTKRHDWATNTSLTLFFSDYTFQAWIKQNTDLKAAYKAALKSGPWNCFPTPDLSGVSIVALHWIVPTHILHRVGMPWKHAWRGQAERSLFSSPRALRNESPLPSLSGTSCGWNETLL